MKKLLLISLAFTFSLSLTYGQSVGVGVGSNGFVVKSNPQNDWRFIGRLDFTVRESGYVQPSFMVARQFINEEKAKFYVGGEIGAQIFPSVEVLPVVVRVPAGIEYFPFDDFPISATAEGGLLLFATSFDAQFTTSSLIEISYYLGR